MPGAGEIVGRTSTRTRVLDAALSSFAARGYEATSLDGLAAGLGIRKQTILHHFGSKEQLLDAVLRRGVDELGEAVDAGLSRTGTGWERLEGVVRAVFSLAGRRPELLGFVREVGRLGPPFVTRLTDALEPLAERATSFLRAEMRSGAVRRHDPRLVLLSAYSTVIGAATEVEVLRSLGVEPSVRLLVRRRRELLGYLAEMVGVRDGVVLLSVRSDGRRR